MGRTQERAMWILGMPPEAKHRSTNNTTLPPDENFKHNYLSRHSLII